MKRKYRRKIIWMAMIYTDEMSHVLRFSCQGLLRQVSLSFFFSNLEFCFPSMLFLMLQWNFAFHQYCSMCFLSFQWKKRRPRCERQWELSIAFLQPQRISCLCRYIAEVKLRHWRLRVKESKLTITVEDASVNFRMYTRLTTASQCHVPRSATNKNQRTRIYLYMP